VRATAWVADEIFFSRRYVTGQQRLLSELSGLKQSIDRARAKSRVGGERLMEDSQVSSDMACVFVHGFFCCALPGLFHVWLNTAADALGRVWQDPPKHARGTRQTFVAMDKLYSL
jgi:hypothetical protein